MAAQALIFLAAAAAFSSPAAAANSPCAHASAAPSHLSTPAASHALRCLINGVRRAHHLRPVRSERHLRSAARRHATDMVGRDYFAHASPGGTTMQSRVRHAGYLHRVREWWLGEALAWGNGGAGAPRAILRGLLNSPPHRAILLDPGFRDLGIGVARGAPQGAGAAALTVALDFGRVRRWAPARLHWAAMGRLTDHVRAFCAQLASEAQSVRIDHDRLAAYDAGADGSAIHDPGLDPVRHYLEGTPADVAMYTLSLDTINFGSGWFPTLHKRMDPTTGRTVSGYFTVAWNLADHFRAHGAWDTEHLRTLRTEKLAAILGQSADHELMNLYSQALRELGRFLGPRTVPEVIAEAKGSADQLAATLAGALAFYDDRGFYKRAQIVPNDLAAAGVATFDDLDALTIFADNLVPHVLRCDGILIYEDGLAARIDAEQPLAAGHEEREIRACALHACELLGARLDVAPRVLDMWLWNRGQAPELKARPRHRTRTVYY